MNSYSKYFLFIFLLSNTILFAQSKKQAVKEVFDISYLDKDVKEDSLHRINFYLPQDVKKPPLLIWIGGGAWSIVDRYKEAPIAKKFAEDGIAVASIGHSLSACVFIDPKRTTGVKHPEHIQDVAKAFHWLHKNAAKYGYDPDKIFVGGFSSGGHLSALLASDEKYLKAHGLSFKNIRGIIPVSGGYDISHYHQTILNSETPQLAEQHVKAVFGDTEENFKDASPTTYLDKLNIPMLMFSDSDTYMYATIFENLLREKTKYNDFEVIHAHKYNHVGIWMKLAEKGSLYRAMAVNFILAH